MGALWMLIAGMLFACMGVFVKLGAAQFSHAELVFYRSFFGLLLIFAIMRTRCIPASTAHFKNHLWRGISGTIALGLFFYCITELPLATAVTLNYTAPMFLTLLTTLVLKERCPPSMMLSIASGFLGVVLLLHPTLQHDQLATGLLGLISGFLAGVAYLNVKQLGALGEPASRTVFYFSLIASVCSGAWMYTGRIHAIDGAGLIILLGLGGTATLAQLAMTQAYLAGNTLVVGSLAYSTILFASLLGNLVWHETIAPAAWAGMTLIIAGGVLSLRLSHSSPTEGKK